MSKKAKILWTITEICSNPEFSAGAKERQSCAVKLDAKIFPHGPMTWKVMQRNAWKVVANWQTKKANSFTKSQQFKEEEMGSVGEKCQ